MNIWETSKISKNLARKITVFSLLLLSFSLILFLRKDLMSQPTFTYALNPEINIETLNLGVTEENVHEIIKDSDLVMDALDNWKTRFIVNDACVQDKIPFIHAGVREFQGQVFVVKPREGACLRCLLPKIPKEERDVPVVGPIVGVVALIQTVEALKLLTGFGQPQISTLLFYDARIQGIEKIKVKKSQKCPVCSKFG